MFQNHLNNDMKVLSFNPAKPPDKSPVGEPREHEGVRRRQLGLLRLQGRQVRGEGEERQAAGRGAAGGCPVPVKEDGGVPYGEWSGSQCATVVPVPSCGDQRRCRAMTLQQCSELCVAAMADKNTKTGCCYFMDRGIAGMGGDNLPPPQRL